MTKLIAQKSFFYGGRTRRKGEVFEATPAHAALLLKTRQVKAHEETEAPAAAEPVAARTRRQYRRRDLRAEG